MKMKAKIFILGGLLMLPMVTLIAEDKDPYLWLEDVTSEKALQWVEAQNAESRPILEKTPGFTEAKATALKVLNSKEKIPYVRKHGNYYYNFWQDASHVRGVYRRTTLEEYRKPDPKWEIVLDIDKLAETEKENWVYKGANFLVPENTRCLIDLSRGGADATVLREFDLESKTFVKDGFQLPEAKSTVTWRDKDSVFVATDFGEGSLSTSGYPVIVKIWKRGTELKAAETILKADPSHVFAYAYRLQRSGEFYDVLVDATSFYSKQIFVLDGDKKVRLDIPEDADFEGLVNGQFVVLLKSDWNIEGQTFKQGSLIVQKAKDVLAGVKHYKTLFTPEPRIFLDSVSLTENTIILNVLNQVISELSVMKWDKKGQWEKIPVETRPNGNIGIFDTHEDDDDFFFNFESFLTPTSFWLCKGASLKAETLKSLPAFFEAQQLVSEQLEATSVDGTKVPYCTSKGLEPEWREPDPTLWIWRI